MSILSHQGSVESIESRLHRGMGGEDIARPGGPEGGPGRAAGLLHEAVSPGKDHKGGMALIEMADLRLDPQFFQNIPAPYSQNYLLDQPPLLAR